MALHRYTYSAWDGSQEIPDLSADDLLEKMSDDLLRGGDPERALRNLLRRGFELPDGRRFEGLQRLLQQMREYRQNALTRYDPNGMIDQIREKLDEILRLERNEIDRRRPHVEPTAEDVPDSEGPRRREGQRRREGPRSSGPPPPSEPDDAPRRAGPRSSGPPPSDDAPDGPGNGSEPAAQDSQPSEFQQMLERMLQRKEELLDQLPENNSGRIHGLREYDFLSSEAREAFEQLVGEMQKQLMEQYFQGLKQGIGQLKPEDLEGIRQMVRDLNEMIEASAAGDREAFDRFMQQHGHYFPPGVNSLEELMQHMQRQMSAMESLLESMDPEMRAELEAMMEELLRDDRLRLDLARLGANLAAMGYAPSGRDFPFRGQDAPGFGQSLEMMNRLQAMQDLENAMRGGDPFNAMAEAGGQDPNGLFGPQLGGQITAVRDMADSLLEAGYLQREGDELSLTASAVRKLGDASLREIFRKLKEDRSGGHAIARKGTGGDITQQSKPYEFGDPFLMDIKSTVMNAVNRNGSGTPVRLAPNDFAVFETERSVQHATVLALDMSLSMYLNDLFVDAKKTALALDSLIRSQFPRDALYLIGFADVAYELNSERLPRLVENDYVRGTNYEMALALARRLLSRHRGGNRQILFVTDGEPTACMLPKGRVYVDWPPTPMVLQAALKEASRCAKEGIVINTFMLNPDPRLIAFVEQMTAVNKGRMFPTGPYHLGEQVVLDYLKGRSVRALH